MAEEFIRGYLAARPLNATALGFHEYDGRITEFTRLAIDAELSRLNRFDERLKRFDVSKLGQTAAIDLRLLQTVIKRELFLSRDLSIYERNPMIYAGAVDVSVYVKHKYAPIEDRVRSIIAVENQAPNVVIAAKTNLAAVLPKPQVELAIQIARGLSDFLKKDLVNAVAELKDESLHAVFLQSNRRAATALTDYAAWLEKEKLPKATPHVSIGEEKYQRFLAQAEMIDLPPQKILGLGLATLKQEQETFDEAAKKIDPTKAAADVFKDVQNEHPTSQDLLPDISKKMDAVRKYVLEHKLIAVPAEGKVQVKEMPQYRRPTTLALMDAPGPAEKKAAEAYFFVTPPDEQWAEDQKNQWLASFNPYSAHIISMRETYPGRYVQVLHLNASKVTKTEKVFGVTSFIEGWAHYCEKMMVDAGFGTVYGPNTTDEEIRQAAKYRMAQAQEAMLQACRLCVSIKIHTEEMSIEEAAKFFKDHAFLDEKLAQAEAMRATFDLDYPNYTLGKLEILKLRQDYDIQEGENFSLKKFHDELLNHGMLPIGLLRQIMLKDQSKWDEVL